MSVPAVSAHAETPTDHTDRCKAIGDALTITRRELRAAPPETALKAALAAASLRLTAAQTITHHACIILAERGRVPPVPSDVTFWELIRAGYSYRQAEMRAYGTLTPRQNPAWNTGVHPGGVR